MSSVTKRQVFADQSEAIESAYLYCWTNIIKPGVVCKDTPSK